LFLGCFENILNRHLDVHYRKVKVIQVAERLRITRTVRRSGAINRSWVGKSQHTVIRRPVRWCITPVVKQF